MGLEFIDKDGPPSSKEAEEAIAAWKTGMLNVKWIMQNPEVGVRALLILQILQAYHAIVKAHENTRE